MPRPKNPFADIVSRMKTTRDKLIREYAAAARRIAAIDEAMRSFGAGVASAFKSAGKSAAKVGRPSKSGGSKYRRGSLKECITKVMANGKVWNAPSVAKAVESAGYKTKNKTFTKSVAIALGSMSNVSRVARGKYKLK